MPPKPQAKVLRRDQIVQDADGSEPVAFGGIPEMLGKPIDGKGNVWSRTLGNPEHGPNKLIIWARQRGLIWIPAMERLEKRVGGGGDLSM